MKQRKLRNHLLLLIQARERKIGRRVKQHDIAEFVGVSDHTIINWIRNNVTRYDANVVEGLCDYFNCDVGDLLYFEWVDEPLEETPDYLTEQDDDKKNQKGES
jgi:transcriptional regulator with XRE-family HTH domain